MTELEHRGHRIFFEESGSGLPVVLLHSYLCSGEMWREQVPALRERYRVINVDLPGHGRSGAIDAELTFAELVDDVCAVLDELEIAHAAWAGLSIGGMITLHAALERPERVSSLLLLDTHAGAERRLPALKYRGLGFGVRLVGWRPFLPQILALMFGRSTLRDRRDLVKEWAGRIAAMDVRSAIRYLELLVRRPSIIDRLPSIRVPALVVVGREDRSLPLHLSVQIESGLAEANLVVVERAGHLSALEQPDEVNRAMIEFLDRAAKE